MKKAETSPTNIEKRQETLSQKELEIAYLQKQLAMLDSYRAMIAAGKDGGKELEDYKKFREIWINNKNDVKDLEARLPEELLDADNPESYPRKVNRNRAGIEAKLQELGGVYPPESVELGTPGVQRDTLEEEHDDFKILSRSRPKEPEEIKTESPTETVKIVAPEKTTKPTASKENPNWKSTFSLWTSGGELPKDVDEEEAGRYVEFVGKARGKETLAYQYALDILNRAKERPAREEAEGHRDEVQKLEEENERLQRELQRAKQEKGGIFAEPKDKEISRLGNELEASEEEVETKKKGWTLGTKFKKGVKGFFDKFKKKPAEVPTAETQEPTTQQDGRTPEEKIASGEEYLDESGYIHNKKEGRLESAERWTVGFLKERAQGFVGGFGWWETHQAEKFRLGTKKTGEETKAQAKLLEQEAGLLDEEEGWEEAIEVEAKRESEEEYLKKVIGKEADPKRVRKIAVEYLSNRISDRKRAENQKKEDEIVASALKKLEDSLKNKSRFEQYKSTYHKDFLGGAVITPEKMKVVEARMREEIGKLRKGQAKKDLVDFIKLSRQSLDKNWWHRYIYTGLEAILAGFIMKWVVGKYFGGKVAEITGAGGKEAIETTHGLKKHIWGDTDGFISEYLKSKGLSWDGAIEKLGFQNKDQVLQHFSEIVAEDSGPVAVKIWKMGGNILDTQMPGGYLLKFGRVALELGAKLAS